MPETFMQSISFIKQTVSEEKIFTDFFRNLPFLGPQQPIKISDQDEGHLKRRALLKHFSKNKNETAEIVNAGAPKTANFRKKKNVLKSSSQKLFAL